jgi:hemoglobin
MQSVYEAAGGAQGLLRLASAWHARVMADDVVRHAFGHGFHPQHTERLAAYWAEALGGPRTFSDSYGDETSVVRLHSGNGAHEEMDRRAIACFDQALTDVALTEDDPVRAVLYDVPDALSLPHWSWDGLQVGEG